MIKNRRFINYVNGTESFGSQINIELVKKFHTVKNENIKKFLTCYATRRLKNPTTYPYPEPDGSSTVRDTGAVPLRRIILIFHLGRGFLGYVVPLSFTQKSSTCTSYLG